MNEITFFVQIDLKDRGTSRCFFAQAGDRIGVTFESNVAPLGYS